MPSIKVPSQVGPQIALPGGGAAQVNEDGLAPKPRTASWAKKVRKMRVHPTLALARRVIIAMTCSIEWTSEANDGADPRVIALIDEFVRNYKLDVTRVSLNGYFDQGWQAFEVAYGFDELSGQNNVALLKPLLHDITDIKVEPESGDLVGVLQVNPKTGEEIELTNADQCLIITIDGEGTDYYGEPLMGASEVGYDGWTANEGTATRYNEKIAGAHWVIHYPIGTSNVNGQEVDNFEIAKDMRDALRANGTVIVPSTLQAWVEELNKNTTEAWKIELISDSGATSTSFTERAAYYDALMVRGTGWPERALLEGKHGTKAESKTHQDAGIATLRFALHQLVQCINRGIINKLLELNIGPQAANTGRIVVAPITDDQLAFLRGVFADVMKLDPTQSAQLDMPAIFELLELPVKPLDPTIMPSDPTLGIVPPDPMQQPLPAIAASFAPGFAEALKRRGYGVR